MKRLLIVSAIVAAVACGPQFGPAERAQVTGMAASIEVCQEVGRACKGDAGQDAGALCYGEYDACMRDAGLR